MHVLSCLAPVGRSVPLLCLAGPSYRSLVGTLPLQANNIYYRDQVDTAETPYPTAYFPPPAPPLTPLPPTPPHWHTCWRFSNRSPFPG